ncbi:MAG: glutamate cyclase domain-containing protein [Gaiellaceae bacterium]
MPAVIGEYVDRLCTIEMRPSGGNLPRGLMHRLYAAARPAGEPPLTLAMAQALVDGTQPGDTVFILTGAGGPPVLPHGEVDGLLGAAALARSLTLTLGVQAVILTEERTEQPMGAVCRAAGLNFRRPADDSTANSVVFIPMPIEADACEAQAVELLDTHRPAAIIAIEKLSPNTKGIIHGSTGISYDDHHAKPQFLIAEARRRGILTAGIGDGGNEVGFGKVAELVADIIPAGRVCACPCGAGNIAAVATDHLVVAAISNWGGYGVAAMIAYLKDDPASSLITEDELERMLRACVDNGAYDGAYARPLLSDDGVPLEAHRAFTTLLRNIVAIGQSNLASPGH